ncbi:hypothetical protein [Rhodobacter sp. NSM]|uniref:hypothetical protein n=1 Tax=Rhodobacter sp. NSM TaxID=3457501 RepID=UPI003FD2B36C
MTRLGIPSFVWTGGRMHEGLEMALDTSAARGKRMMDFAHLAARARRFIGMKREAAQRQITAAT